jgi:NAD(P)-dependent dehydrogenase (short-subunit alcohol dehydrogenase family)
MAQTGVLVIGASRGIGAGLVRHYLGRAWVVHATIRDLGRPGELEGLPGDLTMHELDVRNDQQAAALATHLEGASLDVIIHNAGIYRGFPRREIMAVNAVAPIRIAEALLDAGALKPDGVMAIMTSQMGSRRGRTCSLGDYGDSKAALNDEFRRRADDWRHRGALAVVIHPGWVRTDMGGPSASISVEESVEGVARLLEGLTPEQHGGFWTWQGRELPW